MSFENDVTKVQEFVSIKYLGEAWRDHPDPSGFMRAAHDPKNCLLVWWYNPFTGEFRKTKTTTTSHREDEVMLKAEDLPTWIRGRVFEFSGDVYLMVYIFGAKLISSDFLRDLFDLAQRSVSKTINKVIDDDGNDLLHMFENWAAYKIEATTIEDWPKRVLKTTLQ